MRPTRYTTSDLEGAGFDLQGVAETLRALENSTQAQGLQMSISLLAEAAERALAIVIGCVEQLCEQPARGVPWP